MSLTDTPNANRLHIALFGRRKSGKSSLINALTGQDTALVSDTPGTTTDLVSKAMEMQGIGPCLFIDTPGFDDEGELGELRISRTLKAIEKTDIALLLCGDTTFFHEKEMLALLKEKNIPVIPVLNKIDIRENNDFVGVEFQTHGRYESDLRVGIPGKFNVDNALAAAGVCSFFDLPKEKVCHALEHIQVDGRMEIVYKSAKCTVIVDYAHNAVSMESLLLTLRDYKPKRLVCVFGCGGNRARDRRYSMGEIGGKLADLSIITADNSRFEKVGDILADIKVGLAKTDGKYVEIPDRREAIEYSLSHAEDGDIIAIIGKGHEDYQEIEGVRYHFLDREVVQETVKKLHM